MKANISLQRVTEGARENVWESEDLLPFFWISLLREDELDKASEGLQVMHARLVADEAGYLTYKEAHPGEGNIALSYKKALERTDFVLGFIEEYFPRHTGIYRAFAEHLEFMFSEAGIIELDILHQVAAMPFPDFIKALKLYISAIDRREASAVRSHFQTGTPASLMGYNTFLGRTLPGYDEMYEEGRRMHLKSVATLRKKELARNHGLLWLLFAILSVGTIYFKFLGETFSLLMLVPVLIFAVSTYFSYINLRYWFVLNKLPL